MWFNEEEIRFWSEINKTHTRLSADYNSVLNASLSHHVVHYIIHRRCYIVP